MEKQAHKKFYWIIKNFSLQSERLYSVPVLIGDCKWRLIAYPKGDFCDYFSLFLELVDFESLPCGCGRYAKLRLTLVNRLFPNLSIVKETEQCFDDKCTTLGFATMLPIYKLQEEDHGFLVNGEVKIIAEVDVSEAAGTLNESEISEESSDLLSKKKGNDGNESDDLLKKTLSVKESNNIINGTKQESFITSVEKQVGKDFVWMLENFSFLNSEKCYSDPFVIGGVKWRLLAECDLVSLYVHLCVADSQSFPSEVVKVRLTIVNQQFEKLSILKDSEHCFDEQYPTLGYTIPYELLVEDGGILVNGDLMVVADVIGASDIFEESIPQRKLDVNGFHVLPSQVSKNLYDMTSFHLQIQSVRRIFEIYPEIAVEFRAKNQHLRTTFMNFLLSLIETLYQPLEWLSNEDLVEADIALTYLKDSGFKVDWLEKKMDQVKEKKEK
ncbi:MATH/TRAF domain, partial [Arabidopsis thaliana x Arabidopsis arenosa]